LADHEKNKEKTAWEKAEIILSPVGGLLTALAVAAVGFYGTRYLNSQQERDTNQRVYAELMSKREEADVQLRKDMFKSIIDTFLTSSTAKATASAASRRESEGSVLKLELLAYNFHDSLDLGPLFKQVFLRIDADVQDKRERKIYLDRLQRVAAVVTGRQVSALKEPGHAEERPVDLQVLDEHPEGVTLYEGDMQMSTPEKHDRATSTKEPDFDHQPRRFVLELLKADPITREINVRLRVSPLGSSDVTEKPEVDQPFWVGFFDFPMIDNTRLSHDQRCAVVLNEFDPESRFAEVTVVYFPGDRASLKEKPYYDEVLHSLRRAQKKLTSDEP
jgi:hypothetical protein